MLEIVSEPDMRSAAEVDAYLRKLRSLLRHIGVSEADMEKGQFKCDVNVSLRPVGQEEFGTRTELKNLNSFRYIEAAIGAEVERQAELLNDGQPVVQATMAYDPDTNRTRVLRLKENADDYRYFPDPDLIPLVISEAQVKRCGKPCPSCPTRSAHATWKSSGSPTTTRASSPRVARSRSSSKPRWRPAARRRAAPTGSFATCCRR